MILRYNPDGTPDGTFDGPLWAATPGFAVALQSDGKIVALAYGLLARFLADGSQDGSFGTPATEPSNDVAIQADGKIVTVGSVGFSGEAPSGDFAIARYYGGSAPSPPGGTAPTNSSPPAISGIATDGQELRVIPGEWSGSTPITHSYQWRRCDSAGANCVDIASATGTSYTLTAADVGRTIGVRETATNTYGAGWADSAATAAVKVKPGTIAGTVKSSRKAPIAGATVNCGSAGTATTSATGAYSIANVPPGTYTCTASATGYVPRSQKVSVSSGQQTTANFSLVRR